MSGKVLYTAQAQVEGGRADGRARTSDGRLDVRIRPPKELGGDGEGTNPEQLFAGAFASCFASALALAPHPEEGRRGVAPGLPQRPT